MKLLALVVLLAAQAPVPAAPADKPAITKETRPELFSDEPPPRPGAASQPQSEQPPQSPTVFWLSMLARTILVLGIVVLLAYLILNKGLTRLMKMTGVKQGQNLVLLERLALDQKHSLYLVEVEGRRFVVGTGDSQTTLVCDLTGQNPGQIREIASVSAMTKT